MFRVNSSIFFSSLLILRLSFPFSMAVLALLAASFAREFALVAASFAREVSFSCSAMDDSSF